LVGRPASFVVFEISTINSPSGHSVGSSDCDSDLGDAPHRSTATPSLAARLVTEGLLSGDGTGQFPIITSMVFPLFLDLARELSKTDIGRFPRAEKLATAGPIA